LSLSRKDGSICSGLPKSEIILNSECNRWLRDEGLQVEPQKRDA
jgi:hypothetical protein